MAAALAVIYPDHGDNSYVVLCLTATDSDGRTGSDCVDARPEISGYRFETVPAGLTLNYNGESFVTPFAVDLPVGGERQVSAPPSQAGQVFNGWSNGGDADAIHRRRARRAKPGGQLYRRHRH